VAGGVQRVEPGEQGGVEGDRVVVRGEQRRDPGLRPTDARCGERPDKHEEHGRDPPQCRARPLQRDDGVVEGRRARPRGDRGDVGDLHAARRCACPHRMRRRHRCHRRRSDPAHQLAHDPSQSCSQLPAVGEAVGRRSCPPVPSRWWPQPGEVTMEGAARLFRRDRMAPRNRLSPRRWRARGGRNHDQPGHTLDSGRRGLRRGAVRSGRVRPSSMVRPEPLTGWPYPAYCAGSVVIRASHTTIRSARPTAASGAASNLPTTSRPPSGCTDAICPGDRIEIGCASTTWTPRVIDRQLSQRTFSRMGLLSTGCRNRKSAPAPRRVPPSDRAAAGWRSSSWPLSP
jgi:hypothetical protein